jgi:hypothetical protein
MALVSESQGVSLERISFDEDGNSSTNWHSAASAYHFATPGKENSQFLEAQSNAALIQISPKVFSPDNDGYEDVLEVSLHPERTGYVLQLDVLHPSGRRIRNLANNALLGTTNTYVWDGMDDSGSMVDEGIYILYVMVFHPERGESKSMRKAVALIYR